MQDLSVIEVFSHIDFDSTIQSGLDNFLKAYNSELLRTVKRGGVDDDVASGNTKILNIILKVHANIFTYLCQMIRNKTSIDFVLTVERR